MWVEEGGQTIPQELTKLLSERYYTQRYYNSFYFRPEAQQMKTDPLGMCLILVSKRSQVTGVQFRCQFIKEAHYNCLLNMTTSYTFQVHSNTLYCSRTNFGNITESKTDIRPHPKQPNNPTKKEDREVESKQVYLWILSWVTKSSIC